MVIPILIPMGHGSAGGGGTYDFGDYADLVRELGLKPGDYFADIRRDLGGGLFRWEVKIRRIAADGNPLPYIASNQPLTFTMTKAGAKRWARRQVARLRRGSQTEMVRL